MNEFHNDNDELYFQKTQHDNDNPFIKNYNYSFQPDYNNITPQKRGRGTKAILWFTAAFMLAMAIGIIAIGMATDLNGGFSIIFESSSDDERVPFNRNSNSSYAADTELADAPSAAADPNGPQISMIETSKNDIFNNANRAYEKAAPSIVCITSYEAGKDYILNKNGVGSGIIITSDGYIATNSHVVDDDKKTGVMISLTNGEQYLGTIIGIDKKTDLAVIKIDADNLTPAVFADSNSLYVGQDAYAIGNPGGAKYSNSLTKGTISALNRVLSDGYVKYIQTDAAINPGNSGGALINDEGSVIGMNTIKIVGTNYEGMGFAIPSDQVIEIINKLIKYGYVNDRGTLRIEGTNCTLYQSKTKNIPQGIIITKILSESPLYATGVKEKDIITAINGITVKDFTEFIDELSKFKPDDQVTLTIFRVPEDAKYSPFSFDITVTLIPDE